MNHKRTTFLQLGLTLALGLGLILAVGFFISTSQAAPPVASASELSQAIGASVAALPESSNSSDLPAGVTEEWLASVRKDLGLSPVAQPPSPSSLSLEWSDEGDNAYDSLGFSVAAAGDVNGDGYADVIVGAPYYSHTTALTETGIVYVYYGPDLITDTRWSEHGERAYDNFGFSVAGAGDVNGDGYADVIVGAPGFTTTDCTDAGKVYVYTGTMSGLSSSPAITIVGDCEFDGGEYRGGEFGFSVAGAGDVDCNGYADVIVGAPGFDILNTTWFTDVGRVYVYTSTGSLAVTRVWSDTGENAYDEFGWSVASAGDVDRNGCSDVIVGAPSYTTTLCSDADPVGKVYVYTGTVSGMSTISITILGECEDDGATTYRGGEFGWSVATAGDVNGDGYADVIVGAPFYDTYSGGWGEDKGRAYVYTGTASGIGETAVWTATGSSNLDMFGYSVASARDVNDDGYAEIIVGAPEYGSDGRVYVYYGSYVGPSFDADWTAGGEGNGDSFGWSVAGAGDVDGDSFDDVIIGDFLYNDSGNSDAGKAYVYHGPGGEGLADVPAWGAYGESYQDDYFGYSVANAGDVNGDGFDDVIVGAYGYEEGKFKGRAYVYYGNDSDDTGAWLHHFSSPYTFYLTSPISWIVTGENDGDYFGYSVAGAGDVNGDGYADVVVGAPNYGGRGKVYVYYGSASGMGPDDRPPDWTATGENGADYFGGSVASVGDVDLDGYADLIVGANGYASYKGKAYVYHGSQWGLSKIADWTASGEKAGDYYGNTVASAGDVNGDGYADGVVGAYRYDVGGNVDVGKVYAYYGSDVGLSALSWAATGEGEDDRFGSSVATAGDVDANGYADVIVGAPFYSTGDKQGKAYVYSGTVNGLGEWNRPSDWWEIGRFDETRYGSAVATAGDVNNDGYADVIIAAEGVKGGVDTGRVSVYYGSPDGPSWSPSWGQNGEWEHDYFGSSVASADVNGDGYADVIIGAYRFDWGYRTGAIYAFYGHASGRRFGIFTLPFPSFYFGIGGRRTLQTLQMGGSAGPSVESWGSSRDEDGFWVRMNATDPMGRGSAKLEVQACPPGQPFEVEGVRNTACITATSASWTDPYTTTGPTTPTAYVANTGVITNYRWRARMLYAPACFATAPISPTRDPWRYYRAQTIQADLSTVEADPNITHWKGLELSVASAGDFNGDGYADVIVGAYNDGTNYTGKAYIYTGTAKGLSATPALILTGQSEGDYFGFSVAGAGDVNGDGYDDVIVGAPLYGEDDEGRAYIYYGGNPMNPGIDWETGGVEAGDNFGWSVGTAGNAGDLGCDGYAGVIVGAPGVGTDGAAYVYYGEDPTMDDTADHTFTGGTGDENFGWSVGAAGDVDGDGYTDLIVGAPGYDDSGEIDAGQVYVFAGDDYSLLADETGENRYDNFGWSVGAAGDVNGDGYADVIVGAPFYGESDGDWDRGKAYVYYGPDLFFYWAQTGANDYDYYGVSVGTAGDVNGDGHADIIVGASGYDENGADAGAAYVYAGLTRSTVWTAAAYTDNYYFGTAVAGAGDVNGDGYADWVVAGYPGGSYAGKAYVYYGAGETLSSFDTWSDEGGANWDNYGYSVATAGDVNGDGYADVIVGAYGAGNYTGKANVYHGSQWGLSWSKDFSDTGDASAEFFGYSVAAAGDVNGDGYGDVIVGAPRYNVSRGRAYVYYGSSTGLYGPVWIAEGADAYDYFGASVAGAGDVDGDGYADVIIGAYGTGIYTGTVYVYYGSCGGLSATPDWTASGETPYDYFGSSVASAGDVNGDGFAEVIVGSPGYDDVGGQGWQDAGRAYVYYGSEDGPDGSWYVTGEGEDDRFGSSVATAGDVDGDGYADVVVGAYSYSSGNRQGRVYVYHGDGGGLGSNDRVPHWTASGEFDGSRFGRSVATAGDVNGDGYADLIVGADGYDAYDGQYVYPDAGTAYVYHGSQWGLSGGKDWVFDDDYYQYNDNFGYSAASAGDVNGDGYADVIVGAYRYPYGDRWGAAYVFQGNDGGGRIVLARQGVGDAAYTDYTDETWVVQPWGSSLDGDEFEVRMNATNPMGRSSVRLEVQACPEDEPLDENCDSYFSAGWTNVTTNTTGVVLSAIVDGLEVNKLYRWRARVQYAPLCYNPTTPPPPPHGPWRRLMGQALEADINTVVTDLEIEKTAEPLLVMPFDLLTYTLCFTNHGPGAATSIYLTDVVPSPTFTVQYVVTDSVVITKVTGPPNYSWEVQDLTPCHIEACIHIVGFITGTRELHNPLDGEYIFVDTADIDTRAMGVDDVYPYNNEDDAKVILRIITIGGYTAPMLPFVLFWPRVALLVAAAGGGSIGIAAAFKKRRK